MPRSSIAVSRVWLAHATHTGWDVAEAETDASVSATPGGYLQGRLEAEVGRILVPAHIGRVARVLGPDREVECGLKLCSLPSSLPWAASNSSMARRYLRACSAANASIG